MSDFSDRPFVAGSLVGLRAFDVDRLGRLSSPARGGFFKPGENVATCKPDMLAKVQRDLRRQMSAQSAALRSLRMSMATGAGYTFAVPESAAIAQVQEDLKEHSVAGVDCACGFYAYFDGKNDYALSDKTRLAAVVEGYGVCTVGNRGFRAEKMRLLAIIDPTRRSKWRPLTMCWAAAAAAFLLFVLLVDLVQTDWGQAGIDAACLGLNLALNALLWKTYKKPVPRGDYRAVYPDVPVFASEKKALKRFALTPPAAPSPEDDNFWTVSA